MRRTSQRLAARYGAWALVAGASEGIGRAFASSLAASGLNVVLVARRAGPLEVLAGELRREHGVQVVAAPVDLAADDVVEKIREATGDVDVGLVVYNACYSQIGEFLSTDLQSKLLTLDVNCRGPLRLLDAYLPAMVSRGRGGVVIMSSMAGFQGGAMVPTYAASKAFDTVLGESLWAELGPKGIDVLVCVAGATSTPGFEAQTPAQNRKKAFPGSPEQVAADALAALPKKRRGPTLVSGGINKAAYFFFGRVLSRGAASRFFSRSTRSIYGGE
jgi:uncharacterized protein